MNNPNLADLTGSALQLAEAGWAVFPLRPRDKMPLFPQAHPQGSEERRTCKGRCGSPGHGVWDGTTDLDRVARMWRGQPAANIGLALTEHVMVVDTDRHVGRDGVLRHDGPAKLRAMEAAFGPLPETLTVATGRRDGSMHYYFRRPEGRIVNAVDTDGRFCEFCANGEVDPDHVRGPRCKGVDIKSFGGYVLAPPSVHPDTGLTYSWANLAPVADPPDWLVDLIRVQPEPVREFTPRTADPFDTFSDSVADWFSSTASWADILQPHGWRCRSNDPDADGATWLHPTATSPCSATIQHGCLFIYSTNTVFETTVAGFPKGYTRFAAYALLNHNGDQKAAGRALRARKEAAA